MEWMNWVLGEEIDVAPRVLVQSCHKLCLGVGVGVGIGVAAMVVVSQIENYFLLPLSLFLEWWCFRIQTGIDLIRENLSRLLFLLSFDLKKGSPGVELNGVLHKCQTWKSTLKWCFLPISLKRKWDWLKYSSSFHITSQKTYLSAAESAWEAKEPTTGDDRWCEKLCSLCSFLGLSSTLNKLTKLWSGPTLSTRC